MANLRDLKKDIKQMASHFIQECYVHLSFSPPLNIENVIDLISDAMQLRDETLLKISSRSKAQNRSEQKAYFKTLISDFYDGIVELTERLNTLH